MDEQQDGISILWRRLDVPGHEAVRIYGDEDGWYIDGSAVFIYDAQPCRLEYLIECDTEWKTKFVTVDGFVGDEVISIEIEAENGVWHLDGKEIEVVDGCVDIDLNFSPVTNLLPIKRSSIAVGDNARVKAAWLRFPSFSLEPLEQTYTRKSQTVYSYHTSTGFETNITVDTFGVVVEYSDLWIREE